MARKLAEAEALSPNKKDVSKTVKPKLPKVDGPGDAKPAASKAASKSAAKPASPPTPKPAPAKKPKSPGKPAGT
jgi:hypothetical protein